jgi:hypothetical protein
MIKRGLGDWEKRLGKGRMGDGENGRRGEEKIKCSISRDDLSYLQFSQLCYHNR